MSIRGIGNSTARSYVGKSFCIQDSRKVSVAGKEWIEEEGNEMNLETKMDSG